VTALATLPAVGRRRAVPLWLLVTAGGLVTSVSLGARATFGLFQDPVVETLGTGRGSFALAVAIQNLVWGLSQPFAGAVADRFGTARVLGVGAVVYAAGLVLLANATSPGAVYLSIGFVVGIGTGAASFAVILAAVSRMAPPEKRSMALGITSAMGSVGQFVLVPLLRDLIDSLGWQEAALVLAAIVLTALLAAPFLRGRAGASGGLGADSSEPVALSHELRRAAHSRSYLLLNLGFFVCGFHVTFIGTHLASYAVDIGQTRTVAATALALIGLFNIAGSLAAGYLGGRYAKRKLLSIIYGARAVLFALFILLPPSGGLFLAFGAAMGLLWLSTVPLTSGIVAAQFGTAHVGALFGIVFLSHQLGAFAGAWMGGSLADRLGSYNLVWWVGVGLGLMAVVVHLFIDEGPQPQPPVRLRLAPRPAVGAAVVLALAGLAGLTDGGDDTAAATPSLFCPVHIAVPD
jgi:MFS family permease